MESVTLIIDESGAKGYSDKHEMEEGEFGILAGFLVPDEILNKVVDDFNELLSSYSPVGKKIHITDLESSIQNELRNKIYTYFKTYEVLWIYEAIYVEGYNKYVNSFNRVNKHYPRIKISKNKKQKSLHLDLFKGCFSKALDLILRYMDKPVNINVITDRVDEKILKNLKKIASSVLAIGELSTISTTGYDTETENVFKHSVTFKRSGDRANFPDGSDISFSIAIQESSLTFVADILVNSVYHHLKNNAVGKNLNSKEAINDHELSYLARGITVESSGSITDRIFSHPNYR
jgi:hypothetical protein